MTLVVHHVIIAEAMQTLLFFYEFEKKIAHSISFSIITAHSFCKGFEQLSYLSDHSS